MQDAAINNTSIESIQSQISHPIWPLRLMAHLPPEQEGNSGTMIVRHQLPGHVNTIDAICFNNKRQHLLTADRTCLRLWSLRKELKRINLIPQSTNSDNNNNNNKYHSNNSDNALPMEALVVSLMHAERRDLYICVFGGDPRTKGANSFVDPAVIKIFHPSLSLLLQFNAHTAPVVAAAFHQQREELVTSSTSTSLKVWNLEDSHDPKLATKQQILPPTSPLLYATASNASAIKIVMRRVLQDHDRPITLLHAPVNCNYIFGSGGTDVWVWNLNSGNLLRVVKGLHNYVTDMITSLQYVVELNELTASYDDGVLATWLFLLPTEQHDKNENSITPHVKEVNDDDNNNNNNNNYNNDDREHYNPNAKPILCREFPSHRGRVNCAILSDDKFSLFSCGADGDVRHFDAIHGVELGRLPLASTFRVAFKQGTRRVYPPFAIVHSRINGPAGVKEVLFTVAGSSITIAEVQTQRWRFGISNDSILSINPMNKMNPTNNSSHLVILRENNQVNILDVQTGRVVVGSVPTERVNPKGGKTKKRIRASSSMSSLHGSGKFKNNSGRLNKGIAGLKSHTNTKGIGSRTNTNIHSDGKNINRFGNNLKAIGESSNLLQVVKMHWWEELNHSILGWSDGAVELFDPQRGGLRIRLLRDRERIAPVTSICVMHVPCRGGRNSAFRSGNRVASRTLRNIWDEDDDIEGNSSRKDPNLQIGGSCPSTELNGPWGGPVHYKKTVTQISENVRVEHEKNMAKFTVVTGSADGYLMLWDVVKSRMITSMQAHSGPIVDILEIPTLEQCEGALHPVVGKLFPPPLKKTVVSVGEDGIIKVWSAWRSGRLNQVAFFLAQPSSLNGKKDIGSGKNTASGNGKKRRAKVTSSIILKGSKCLVVGYDNGSMQGWELQTELNANDKLQTGEDKVFLPFWSNQSHVKSVSAMCSPSNGDYFASASLDGTIMMWGAMLLEDVNLANIVLLRSFSINVPIQSINFIANDRVILASHVEGMTVLKANVRSGIAQRKLVIEHKKKKLVMLEENSSIQDSSKADTKKEEIGQHGTVVATTQEESAKTEEKSESIVVETEKIPAEKSFPITGYVPYNDVVTSPPANDKIDKNVFQQQNSNIKQPTGSLKTTSDPLSRTVPTVSLSNDFQMANQLRQASFGGLERTKSMTEIPQLSKWGERHAAKSIPSNNPMPPGAMIHNAQNASVTLKSKPQIGWMNNNHSQIDKELQQEEVQQQSSGVLNNGTTDSSLRRFSSSFKLNDSQGDNLEHYVYDEKNNITHNFSMEQEIERSLSTRGSNIRPFSTGDNSKLLDDNSMLQRLPFKHDRPGSREGIIKIVVSGTKESVEDVSIEGKVDNELSGINMKSQVPLEGTSMEDISKELSTELSNVKQHELPADSNSKEATKSNKYHVNLRVGLDPMAIAILREEFTKLCLPPQIKLKFEELPKVLEHVHIGIGGKNSNDSPELWKLWNLHESIFKLKRSIPDAAVARMNEPTSNYQKQLMEERIGRTLVTFDDFLLVATAYVQYLKSNWEALVKLERKQKQNSQAIIKHNIRTVVEYNSIGEVKTHTRNIAVSKGISEGRMWREIEVRAKRAGIASKARFESLMQTPDVWDGGDSKGTLSITPKNRWCQHSQIAINTLSAFARQLSTLTKWPRLHPIYRKIHTKKLHHVMLSLENQALQGLKNLGENYVRPMPLRKVLKNINFEIKSTINRNYRSLIFFTRQLEILM